MPIHKGQKLSDEHRAAIRDGIRRKVSSGWKPDAARARAGLAAKREREKIELQRELEEEQRKLNEAIDANNNPCV